MLEGSTYNLVTRILLVDTSYQIGERKARQGGPLYNLVTRILLVYMIWWDTSYQIGEGGMLGWSPIQPIVTRILLVQGEMVGHFLLDRRGRDTRGPLYNLVTRILLVYGDMVGHFLHSEQTTKIYGYSGSQKDEEKYLEIG